MKLGVISDCFKKPMKESIELAGKLQLDGIQMYAVSGDICPDALLPYPEKIEAYKKTGKIVQNAPETSDINNSHNFADQSSNIFLYMYIEAGKENG